MKKKLLVLLSVFIVALCATTFVACNQYNDEKLIAEKVVSIEYGESLDFEKFHVAYYKDGETHPLTLKGKKDPFGHYDNPDGDYTWDQISSDTPKQLDVEHPEVGLYDLIFEYQNVSKIVSLEVRTATYSGTISISADASTKYLGEKINISLSDEPAGAQITYRFAKCTNVNTSGEEEYVSIGSRTKSEYELWNKDTMFMSLFHVGKYRVYADIIMKNYNPIVTEPVTFVVEKSSLKGKYYIANQDATVKYVSDRLGDYAVPNAFYLQPNGENPLPYELTENNYTLEWDDPEQVVGLSDIGIAVTLKFTSEDFTLNDSSDTKEVTLYIEQAEFPYAETALFVDGTQYDGTAHLDYDDSYTLAVKVAQTHRSRFIDVPTDKFTLTILDKDDNELNGTYTLTAEDITNGYFVVKYSIVSKDGKYKTKTDTLLVYFNEAPEPEPDPGE